VLTAGLGGVVIGTAVGWNSPADQLMTKDKAAEDGDRDPVYWALAGSYCLGTTVGGLVHRPLADSIGFRRSAAVYDAAVFAGWLVLQLQQPAIDSGPVVGPPRAICAGRLIQGLGAGGLGLSTPTYISHIADPDVRGECGARNERPIGARTRL